MQSTDKMGMGCASWGPMALGALPLCIWGPGLPQGRTWGGRGASDRDGNLLSLRDAG